MLKMPLNLLRLMFVTSLFFYTSFASAVALFPKTCEISPNSIGKIRLGSTLNQLKTTYPNVKLTRVTDGDGVALVSVTINNQDLAILYAGESESNDKINFSNKIEQIETFNSKCKTKLGIHPEMPLKKAVGMLGDIDNIRMSEIEGRQYVKFKKHSSNFIYKINYCGDFANDNMRDTNKYLPDCTLKSITISR